MRDTRSVHAGAAVPTPIRVLLADERPLFANAVQTILATHPRFELVGVAFDGEEALELATELEPDVVLIDADLPEVDAVEAHDAGAGAYLPRARSAADLLDTLEFTALLLDAADALPQKP